MKAARAEPLPFNPLRFLAQHLQEIALKHRTEREAKAVEEKKNRIREELCKLVEDCRKKEKKSYITFN